MFLWGDAMYNAEETKKQILECAIRLFALNGFAQTSIADIVSDAGCSKGVLFYHFPSKEALIEEAFLKCHDAIEEAASEGVDAIDSVVEKLCRRCYQLTRHAIGHPSEAAVNSLYLTDPSYCAKNGYGYRASNRHFECVNRLVSEGLAKGELKDMPILLLGEMFYSIASVPYTYMQNDPTSFENSAYWADIYEIIRCAMAKKPYK